MSVMTVTEYVSVAVVQVAGVPMQVPQEPPLVEQAIAITSSSTQTAAFNANTTLIRINIDGTAAAAVTVGLNPTATVPSGGLGSGRMSANATEYRGVIRGLGEKVAVIATT
jgi:hypothetical protein